MKRSISVLIVAATLAVMSTGCSTIGARVVQRPNGPYPAVRVWPSVAKETLSSPEHPGQMFSRFGPVALPFVLVDLPLAVAFDTVFLPADIIDPLTRRHENSADSSRR